MVSKATVQRARQEIFGDESALTPIQKRLRQKLEARQEVLLGEAVAAVVLSGCAPADAPADIQVASSQSAAAVRRLASASFYSQRNDLQSAPLGSAQAKRLDALTRIHTAYDAAMGRGVPFGDFLQGQIALGRVPELIDWFQCHTKAHRQSTTYAALAGLFVLRQDAAAAKAALGSAIAHGASVCRAYGDAGNLVFRAGDMAQAIPLLRAAVLAGPREIDLHERLAMCLFGTGAQEEVEPALAEAQKHGALTERGWTILGQVALHADDPQRAVAALRRALEVHPNHTAARLGIASAYGMLEDIQAVREHVDVLLLHPPTKDRDIETLMRIFGAVIGRGVDAQDPQRLLHVRDWVLAHAPRNNVTLRLLADALARIRLHDAAAAVCQSLLALPMADPETSLELADLCLRCGQSALALQALQVGHKTFKNDTGLARRLAHSLLAQERRPQLEQVLPLLRMAMDDGSQVEADRAMIVAVVDKLLASKQAAETLWRMCTFRDTHKQAYLAVARIYLRLGTFSNRAEKALRYVLSQAPEDASARLLLGRLLKSVGRLHEAAPYLDPPVARSATIEPGSLMQRVCTPKTRVPDAGAKGENTALEPLPLVMRHRTSVLGKTVEGVWRGYSCDGSMVLEADDGSLCWSGTLVALGDAPSVARRAQDSVPLHLQCVAAPRVVQMFDAELARPVQGTHTSEAYIEALAGCGGETFLVGGTVRRILYACAHEQRPPDAQHDIDMVTSLAPAPMFWMTRDVARDVLGTRGRPGGVTSPPSAAWHGVVSYGRVDIASLRTRGMFADKVSVLGRAAPVYPLAFNPDIAADSAGRDFRCNAIYYDPRTQHLFDPTDGGIEDAIHKRLRLVSAAYVARNPTLALRYCKLRCEGYSTDAATSAHIRDNAKRFLAGPDMPRRIARLIASSAACQPQLMAYMETTLAAWGAILAEDCSMAHAPRTLARHLPAVVQACSDLQAASPRTDMRP